MLTRLTITGLLLFGLTLGAAYAEDEKAPKPDPDFYPVSIRLPEQGLALGANQLKVTFDNRAKDSEVEGNLKFELVVLGPDDARQSYFGEVDAMRFGQKREVLLEGVKVDTTENVRFLVILDPENSAKESNEDNNRYIFQAKIKGPETEKPETEVPEAKAPETEVPEAKAPESEVPETKAPESEVPEAKASETEVPEANDPETAVPEAKAPKSDASEAETPEP